MLDINEMVVMYYFRVLKEALRSSGANCTEKHTEELSMCSLLLLDVAKRSDHEFDTPYHSSRHTIRSADDDIKKMVKYLIEEKVTQESENGAKISFKDPLVIGMQKVVDGWLKFLVSPEPDTSTEDVSNNELELNYELYEETI